MKTHDLKVWPVYFRALEDGTKPFEFRKNDRNYAPGDFLYLQEYEPIANVFTGRHLTFRVTYVMSAANTSGLGHDLGKFVVLGLARVYDAPAAPAVPAPPPKPDEPNVILKCRLVDLNVAMQVVEDERGERHQLTGVEMCLVEGMIEGWQGTIAFWYGREKREARFERNELCGFCGMWVPDWVDPEWAQGRVCRECETKYQPHP